MIFPKNREMMVELYRLIEQYEVVPQFKTRKEIDLFFQEALKKVESLYYKYLDCPYCLNILHGFYSGLDETYKKTNPVYPDKEE